MNRRVTLNDRPGWKGAGITAVKDQHVLPRPAPLHCHPDLLPAQPCERKVVAVGVGHSQVQLAIVVFETMTGEVEQRQIVTPAVPVEVADRSAYFRVRAVMELRDLKAGDGRVTQDGGQFSRVTS